VSRASFSRSSAIDRFFASDAAFALALASGSIANTSPLLPVTIDVDVTSGACVGIERSITRPLRARASSFSPAIACAASETNQIQIQAGTITDTNQSHIHARLRALRPRARVPRARDRWKTRRVTRGAARRAAMRRWRRRMRARNSVDH
jgi:hypothetical protein